MATHHLPAWDLQNLPASANRPGLTIGLNAPPGPALQFGVQIRQGSTVVATWSSTGASGASTAGDGTGIDDFGAQGPLDLEDGVLYTIVAWATVAGGNLGYSNGRTTLYDISSDWPVGLVLHQLPTAPVAAAAPGVVFPIGSFYIGSLGEGFPPGYW